MLKVQLFKLRDAADSLTALGSTQLSALLSFKLGKILKNVTQELSVLEETRIKKAKELGSLNSEGKNYEFTDENWKNFQEQMISVLNTEITVPFEMIKVSELGDIKLEPKHFALMDWLIGE